MATATPVLKNRTFLIIWGGQIVSMLGDMLFDLALIWWVLAETGSGTAMAAVALAAALPSTLLGPLCGALVDRMDRRKLMIGANAANGILMLGVAVMYWRGIFSLPLILLASALNNVGASLHSPAFQAAIPIVVEKEDLVRANSLTQSASSTLGLVAPAISGVIIAVSGAGSLILFNGISYLAAALSLCFVQFASSKADSASHTILKDTWQGLRYVFSHSLLLPMLLYAAVINLTLAPVTVALPLLIANKLAGGPALLGLFYSFRSAGVLIASLSLSAFPKLMRKMGLVMVSCIVAIGIFTVLISISPLAIGVLLGGACIGFSVVVANIASQAIWQREVLDEYRGRAFAAKDTVSLALRPLGLAAAGPLVDWVGPQLLMGAAGVLCAVSGIVGWLMPVIIKYPIEHDVAVGAGIID